jgi:hypothetical protein
MSDTFDHVWKMMIPLGKLLTLMIGWRLVGTFVQFFFWLYSIV